MRDDLVPGALEILGWIERIYAQGIRRPGYPADRWAEEFCAERFRDFGLENVRLEPAPLPYWEPRSWSLHARGEDGEIELPCFPLPHSAPTEEIELPLVPFDPESPSAVEGKASLHDTTLLRIPPASPVTGGSAVEEVVGDDIEMAMRPGGRVFDSRGSFDGAMQVLPFGSRFQWVMEPALYPPTYYLRAVPSKVVHVYTLIQFACLAVLWTVKASAVGILFPLFIAVLVPVRMSLDRYFKPEHLALLDAEEAPEEEEFRVTD